MLTKSPCGHTDADHRYRDAVKAKVPFRERLRLIPAISDRYLAELLATHHTAGAAPIRTALETELALRGSATERRNFAWTIIGLLISTIVAIVLAVCF